MKSKLSDHIFKKGKFITPWNNVLGSMSKMQSWCLERLPEYLWLGLVLEKYGRKEGLEKSAAVLQRLHEINGGISVPAFSLIIKLDAEEQKRLYDSIGEIIDKDVLSPLTLLYTYSDYPEFSRGFCNPQITPSDRQQAIATVLEKAFFHQSELATDIRFLVLYFSLIKGNFQMPAQELELIMQYPLLEHSDEMMRIIRPSVRATEMVLMNLEVLDEQFLEDFWRRISKMSECNLFYIKFPGNELDANKYIELLHEVFQYLSNCFTSINPLDKKMLVLLGISIYSYKRLIEIVEHDLYNSIAARSTIRTIIESYIMMKYLLTNENSQHDIWDVSLHKIFYTI